MQIDFLIIGQGICGTFLSWYLQKEGKSFLVIDNGDRHSPSRIAAGIINPVTGRRHVTAWLADEILPFAWNAYREFGHESGITAITQKNIIDFFPSPQMRHSFLQRIEESDQYVHSYPDQNQFNHLFNFDFGCGEIRPVYTAHLEILLPAWRQRLVTQEILLEEEFEIDQLQVQENSIRYKDITAGKILFCDGNSSSMNPCFRQLPFAPNKGEALVLEIQGLPDQTIYKKGMMLAPMTQPGLFWMGSDYQWEFENADPSKAFRERTEHFLKEWLKMPFKILEHLAGIRPATLERRPFVGLHPHYPNIGILNGMGTKGCSLAPFFAKQLADHLINGHPILPEADITRFSKILAR
jgi:glycine/D-amino acid oxidase-like deaminating enzyme